MIHEALVLINIRTGGRDGKTAGLKNPAGKNLSAGAAGTPLHRPRSPMAELRRVSPAMSDDDPWEKPSCYSFRPRVKWPTVIPPYARAFIRSFRFPKATPSGPDPAWQWRIASR